MRQTWFLNHDAFFLVMVVTCGESLLDNPVPGCDLNTVCFLDNTEQTVWRAGVPLFLLLASAPVLCHTMTVTTHLCPFLGEKVDFKEGKNFD